MVAHYVFGFMWLGAVFALVMVLTTVDPYYSTERAQRAWGCAVVVLFALVLVGLVGRALTPGAFWHS